MLENKLNITDSSELARIEEKISKQKAVEMFEHMEAWLPFINIFLMKFMISPACFVK